MNLLGRQDVAAHGRRPPRPGLLLACLAGSVVACQDGGAPLPTADDARDAEVSPPAVRDVAVAAPFTRLALGTRLPLAVTVRDVTGAVLTDRSVAWTSSDSAVIAVDAAGVATARALGSAQVTATVGGQVGTVALIVVPVPVAGVIVDRANIHDVHEGDRLTLRAWAVDSAAGMLAGRTLSFTSSAPSVATISPTAAIDALAAGRTTLTASSEGRSVSVDLLVGGLRVAFATGSGGCLRMRVGATCDVFAQVRTAGGNSLVAGRYVDLYASADTAIASVTATAITGTAPALGVRTVGAVRARAPGSVSIVATYVGPNGVRRQDTFPVVVDP